MGMKRCYKCVTTKPVGDFGKSEARKDGLQTYCKGCRQAHWKENSEALSVKQKVYHAANREDRNKKQKVRDAIRFYSLTPVERAAKASVTSAITRTELTPSSLRAGATYSEALTYTLPFAEERLRLEEETGMPHHIDHIKPICEGGLHIPSNLQVLSATENQSKGPVWFLEDHLTDTDIERLDQEALEFTP